MWIKVLVGVVLTAFMLISGVVIVKGIFLNKPNVQVSQSPAVTAGASEAPPVITLTADMKESQVGKYATLTWEVTGVDPRCEASGDWSGVRTASGTMSTGRFTAARKYTFKLACATGIGTTRQSVDINVTQ